MDIVNVLQAYLNELDDISNTSKDFHFASQVSNLGRHVQVLIEKITEFENSRENIDCSTPELHKQNYECPTCKQQGMN